MIKGLTTDRAAQFPRIGTLRKGGEKPERGPGRDLDHFRFDTEDARAAAMFEAAYGKQPRRVNVYLPYATTDGNFQAWQESWTASTLNHRCDGETTYTYGDDGHLVSTGQPCPDLQKLATDRNRCKQVGRLQVIIPELERFAYVTVLTSSKHDIIALSEQLMAIEALRKGDMRGIPLALSRNEREIAMTDPRDGSRKRVTKWMLAIEVAPEWAAMQLEAMRRAALALPAPAPVAPQLPAPELRVIDRETGEIIERPAHMSPLPFEEFEEANVTHDEEEPAETESAPVNLTPGRRAAGIRKITDQIAFARQAGRADLVADLADTDWLQADNATLVSTARRLDLALADVPARNAD